MKKSKLTLRCLCEARHHDRALAQILGLSSSSVQLPQGGSITLSMLPIFLFCIPLGLRAGHARVSFAFSLLQLFLDGAYACELAVDACGDYMLGLYGPRLRGPVQGQEALWLLLTARSSAAFAALPGPLCHRARRSGQSTCRTTFFGMTMTSPWFYSALYNGSYMVLDCALVLLVGWILWKPMGKYIRGDDIKALRGDGK